MEIYMTKLDHLTISDPWGSNVPSSRQIEPARLTKWLQRQEQNMLSITIIQEPLDVLFLRINFKQRDCSNDKFQRRIWSLVYQFAGVLENERKGIFLTKEERGVDKYTPGSPRYWLPYISLFQAFRSWGRRKAEQKQKPARPILLLLLLLLLLSRSIKL